PFILGAKQNTPLSYADDVVILESGIDIQTISNNIKTVLQKTSSDHPWIDSTIQEGKSKAAQRLKICVNSEWRIRYNGKILTPFLQQ
uniref:Uncharacterized protein n=1 Tax=Megaselia scalaris TaxID=36166 RepID=T1GXZ5_MEGSC